MGVAASSLSLFPLPPRPGIAGGPHGKSWLTSLVKSISSGVSARPSFPYKAESDGGRHTDSLNRCVSCSYTGTPPRADTYTHTTPRSIRKEFSDLTTGNCYVTNNSDMRGGSPTFGEPPHVSLLHPINEKRSKEGMAALHAPQQPSRIRPVVPLP